MKTRLLRATLALTLTLGGRAVEAATSPDERAHIWAIARLVLQSGSDEGLATIRAGIRDQSPAVRATAARISRATGAKGVIVDLREALSKEPDAAVTLEILAALASLDESPGSDEALIASVQSADTGKRLLELVAARGRRMAALWPRLKATMEEHSWMVARGLQSGLHQAAPNLFASHALRDAMEDLYDALLFTSGLEIPPGVVTAGLASPASGIRSSAYIAVADRNLPVTAVPPTFDQTTLCERVSRHLFEAARGFARTETLATLMTALSTEPKARKCVQSRFSDARDSIRGLSPPERRLLLKGIEVDKDLVDLAVGKVFDSGAGVPPSLGGKKVAPLRTLSGHSPDFVQAVLEGTKCKGRERAFDGVDVVYAEGGGIQSALGLKSGSSAEGCGEAAKILGLTSYLNGGYPQVTKSLPERPEFLACLVEPDPPQKPSEIPPAGARVGGNIKEPKKVKSESPRYPTNPSLGGKTQGIVILEALIRPSGCVGALTVLRSVHPILDLEAINAVSGWRYTPTYLNGAAVPVIVTVTVNFRLN